MNIRQRLFLAAATLASVAAAACDSLMSKPSLYGSITTQVLRRDSTVVPGANVVLYTGQRPIGYAITDSTGSFKFVDVPDGMYGVRIVPPSGYVSLNDLVGGGDTSVVRDGLTLPEAGNLFVRFRLLKSGSGTITAFVEGTDRKPLAGIRVVLYSSAGSIAEGVTASNGMFAFPSVPLGNYGVFAARPPAFTDSAENPLPSRDGFVVDQGSVGTASFQFAPCVGTIDVRVRDNTSAPVPGTLLTFYGNFGVQDSVLGADASRRIDNLGCGVYGVRIRPPVGYTADEVRGVTFADNLSIHRGTALNVTLNIKRIGRATVRVRVIDNLDIPVENVRVVLYTGQGLVRDLLTDGAGFVTMPDLLVNAEYGVRVLPRAGYTSPEGPGTTFNDGIKLVDGEIRDYVFRFKRD